jgi:hypothetical protein
MSTYQFCVRALLPEAMLFVGTGLVIGLVWKTSSRRRAARAVGLRNCRLRHRTVAVPSPRRLQRLEITCRVSISPPTIAAQPTFERRRTISWWPKCPGRSGATARFLVRRLVYRRLCGRRRFVHPQFRPGRRDGTDGGVEARRPNETSAMMGTESCCAAGTNRTALRGGGRFFASTE